MSYELDDEILQDFLVEAGELLEQLGEQLIQLEQSPDDLDLLNAIFRGFHTVKGGAGFLNINPLVAICHNAEDVFNVLRQGDRCVEPALMDVVLDVLDVVNVMFEQVRNGEEPVPAEPELLSALSKFSIPDSSEESVATQSSKIEVQPAVEASAQPTNSVDENNGQPEPLSADEQSDEITESEFEDLLDALHGNGKSPGSNEESTVEPEENTPVQVKTKDSDDLINDDEFENLLDELHGKGKHKGIPAPGADITENKAAAGPKSAKPDAVPSDEISEDEFEALLDGIHGKGQHGGRPDPQPDSVPKTESKAVGSVTEPPATQEKPAAVASKPPKKSSKPAQPPAETTVRVDVQRLDEIMNMVGELVLVRNRFENLRASNNPEEIGKAISNLDVVTSDLQRSVMKTRMQPIKKVFGRFPRVVRDLARSLKKEIRLELNGEETDLDKNLVEALADPLVHLVRNAVDHGVELPEEREAAGKPREGKVVLTASQQGDHIQLIIEDDGRGMNPEVLRKKVVEKGLIDEDAASRLDNKGCFNLIFLPGFSTKDAISDVSGRGVGMDVVKTRIVQMNGTVEVDSVEGQGSSIIIKVPLTLAILPTLMVMLGDQPFALPLVSVVEILDLDLERTNVVDGQLVVLVRDRALPLFYLGDWLLQGNSTAERKRSGHVVIVSVGGQKIGFVVDHLVGQEEVVIKALGAKLNGLEGLAGATITGDGNIALILDVPSLMKRYAA